MEIGNRMFHAGCEGLAKKADTATNRDGFNEKKRFS
jgi:hypothetical protein